MGRKKTINLEDKKFWNVIYNELSRNNCNDKFHCKYIARSNFDRYCDVYPVNESDLKVYESDSRIGLNVAKEVAEHFDLDIVFGTERTKYGKSSYAIIKIPRAIMNTIYNDDYED